MSCCLSITFCFECCSGVIETFIEQVTPESAACDGVSPQDMIQWASNYVNTWAALNYLNSSWLYYNSACNAELQAGCPDGYVSTQVDLPTCWTQASLAGQYTYSYCSAAGCVCETPCTYCWNGTSLESSCGTTTTVGDCICLPAPNDAPWINGTCYSVCP